MTTALGEVLAAEGAKPIVMCHISHVYPAGLRAVKATLDPQGIMNPGALVRAAEDR